MAEPLCSIIVSSYNRPRLICDALDSILAQTWPKSEVIVADDYSDGVVYEELSRFQAKIIGRSGRPMRIVAPHFGHGLGVHVPSNRERQHGNRCALCINAAMRSAAGDYVAFLPDDDMLTPHSIQCRVEYMEAHPLVNVVYGRLEACKGITGEPVHGLHYEEQPGFCRHNGDSFYSEVPIMRAANKVDHGMIMVRRVDSLPEWPERPTAEYDCEDAGFLYCCEMAGLSPFHSVPDVVIVKRYHRYAHRADPRRRE